MLEAVDNLFSSWYTFFFVIGFGVLYYIRTLLKGAQCISNAQLKGKTVIITGASGDLGEATAIELAGRGARVILACRDEAKGNELLQKLKTLTGNKNAFVMHLDVASFKSIKQFVKRFSERKLKTITTVVAMAETPLLTRVIGEPIQCRRYSPITWVYPEESGLHVLINNAGVMCCPKTVTEDGYETHFQVNYLGPFLLTHLLLDNMKKSSPSRIINVSAVSYKLGQINFDDFNFENTDYVEGDAYSQSKLALVHFTTQLSKHLKDSGVTVNTVHPGISNTNIYRHMGFRSNGFLRFSFSPICFALMKTANDGAQTIIHCAVAEELEGVSGKFFSECKEEPLTDSGCDEEVASKLFLETKKLLKLD